MAQFLQPHQQLAGYEVLELVGKGGMGEVYKARQLSMDRVVALKVLNVRQAKQDPSFAKSFVEEARSAGRLGHPNIISVHDVGSTNLPGSPEEVYYFSMEFIDGETLKDVIKRQGPCEEKLVALVMNGMAEALEYAEKHGIVHRDIKPDNIMLGSNKLVKLADLGLALQVGGEQISSDGEEQDKAKVMGTPMYMSPEQARALKLDHRSDQYSLGATLYHMLTGRPPYDGADAKSIMRAHVFDPIPDPKVLRPDLSDPWRALCMRLMAKSPDARFHNAADLRAAVQAAIHGEAIPSVSKRTPRVARRAVAGRGLAWGGVAAAAVVAIGAVIVFSGRGGTQSSGGGDHPSTTATEPPQRVDETPLLTAIKNLPADHEQALAELAKLASTPVWSGAHPQSLIADETAKRRAALDAAKAEAAKESAMRTALAPVKAAILAGDLKEAKSLLGAFADAHRDALDSPAFKESESQLNTALEQLAGSFRARIEKAGSESEVDGALSDARRAQLSGDDQSALEKLAAKRKDALRSISNQQAEAALRKAWEDLAVALDQKRRDLSYGDAQAVVAERIGSFPQDAQDTVRGLDKLGDFASVGETTLKKWLEARRQTLDASVDGKPTKAQVRTWSLKEVEFIPDPPAQGAMPPSRKAPRASMQLPFADLLDQALAERRDLRDDAPKIRAVCLWMWRCPEARAAIAGLGDQPLGRALHELDRALACGLAVNAPVERDGDLVRVRYDFVFKRPALLDDFAGAGLVAGDQGLLWTTKTAVAKGSRVESLLPTVTWKEALLPPCAVHAVFRLHGGTTMGLAGVQAGGRRVRIGFSHGKHPSQRLGLVITADDGAKYIAQEMARGEHLWPADQPLVMDWKVDEQGRVAALVNGQPVGPGTVGGLPGGAPVSFVLQAYQYDGETTLELTSLELSGKPQRR
jgi:serine/threonine-protein kinase